MLLLSICCMMSRHAAIFGLIGCEYAMTNPSLIDERIPQDESGVRRTSGGDEFIVELEGTRPTTGSVTDNLDGMWSVALDSARGLVRKLAPESTLCGPWQDHMPCTTRRPRVATMRLG